MKSRSAHFTKRRGEAMQKGIVTPTALKPLNQEIQWEIQTLGTEVPEAPVGTPNSSASPCPHVIF